jgi:uncharacterized membrane protein YkoI
MKRAKILAALTYLVLAVGTLTFMHYPDLKAAQAGKQVRAEQARLAALQRAPGEIKDSDLEVEGGKLIYSFDIQQPGKRAITEVHVSAKDASIMSVGSESVRD